MKTLFTLLALLAAFVAGAFYLSVKWGLALLCIIVLLAAALVSSAFALRNREQWFNCPYCPNVHDGRGVVRLQRTKLCAPMMECPDCKRVRKQAKRLINERLEQYFAGN